MVEPSKKTSSVTTTTTATATTTKTQQQTKSHGDICDLGTALLKRATPTSAQAIDEKIDKKERELYEGLLSPKHFQELRDEFFKDDVDHDGYVDKKELKEVLTRLYSHVFTPKELQALLKRYEDKKIDFYEFVGLYTAERIEEKLLQLQSDPEFENSDPEVANAKFVFSIFDTEDRGRIEKRELRCMLRQMGRTKLADDDKSVDELLHKFAKKHHDSIEFDEFLRMLKSIKATSS